MVFRNRKQIFTIRRVRLSCALGVIFEPFWSKTWSFWLKIGFFFRLPCLYTKTIQQHGAYVVVKQTLIVENVEILKICSHIRPLSFSKKNHFWNTPNYLRLTQLPKYIDTRYLETSLRHFSTKYATPKERKNYVNFVTYVDS